MDDKRIEEKNLSSNNRQAKDINKLIKEAKKNYKNLIEKVKTLDKQNYRIN